MALVDLDFDAERAVVKEEEEEEDTEEEGPGERAEKRGEVVGTDADPRLLPTICPCPFNFVPVEGEARGNCSSISDGQRVVASST